MDKNNKKQTKGESPDVAVARVNKFLDEALGAWRTTHLNWFVFDSFYKGNHYLNIDTRDFSVRNVPVPHGVTVPYIYHVVKTIANNVSKVMPKWNFIPNASNPKAVDDATNIGLWMDKVFETSNFSQLLRDAEKLALKFSATPVYVGWDAKNNRCALNLENPFYVIPDPRATELQDAKYIIRIVECDLLSLKNNPDYDQKAVAELQPETKVGGTPVYERVMTETNKIYPNQVQEQKDNFSVFVKEFYEKVEEEGVQKIKLTCVCQSSLLYEHLTDLEDFPFEFLYSDKDPLTFYGEGWVKSLIPINKMINKLETQKAVYVDAVARGRYNLPKGSTIERKTVNGVEVTFYDLKGRDKPEPEAIPPWPGAADSSIAGYNDYMRLFGAFSDIATGNVPPGIKAAKALELLITQDGNNTIEVKKNLADFVKRVAKKILWNYSHYLDMPTKFQLNENEPAKGVTPEGSPAPLVTPEGDQVEVPRVLEVIGSETPMGKDMAMSAENGADYNDITFLPADMDLKVDIDSELASTEQGRWDQVMELIDRGLIPQEIALDMLKVGNVKDIMKKVDEIKRQEAQNPPPPTPMKLNLSIGYRDLPPETQRAVLEQNGIPSESLPTVEEIKAQKDAEIAMQQMAQIEPRGSIDQQLLALAESLK